MDTEIQEALTQWLGVQLRERRGPSPHESSHPNGWRGDSRDAIDSVLREIVPEVAKAIADTHWGRPPIQGVILGYRGTWPLLPDSVIGVLMQAGAKDYLPPVEVK